MTMTNLRIFSNGQITTEIIPLVGGGQAGATQMNPGWNSIQNPASDGDSVQLPLAISGTIVIAFVEAFQANMVGFFAKEGSSDTIFGQPNNTQYDFLANAGVSPILMCFCPEDGLWIANYAPDGFPGP